MEKYNMFQDEFNLLEEKKVKLLKRLKEAGEDAWDALQQSSETWHDNAPLDVARLNWELASKQLREVQNIMKNTNIVSSNVSDEIVAIWKKITVLIDNNEEKTILIWWYQTSVHWRVSYNAPIVRPLIWKRIWDIEDIMLWWKLVEVEIINIIDWIDINVIK